MFNEIVHRVDDYLDGYSSLSDFKAWFYDLAFDVERHYAGGMVDLVHEIEGILAESSSGKWPISALDRELNAAIAPYRRIIFVHVNDDGPKTSISSVPLELIVAQG